jgi:hypothetical protein
MIQQRAIRRSFVVYAHVKPVTLYRIVNLDVQSN